MYDMIGFLLFTALVASIALASIALIASRISLDRHVWLAGFYADILDYFHLPIKYLFHKCASTETLDRWMTSLKNMANKPQFKKTQNRLLLAPHCMRAMDCPASSSPMGIQCISCGKCLFSKIKEDAERFNYRLYIVAGSSYIRHIIKKESADGALLVACHYELNKVMRSLKSKNIVTYGVPLLNDGCYATNVDHEQLLKVMEELS